MWGLSELIALNKSNVEADDRSLELELYQSTYLVDRCNQDPDGFGQQLYAALCNVTWIHSDTGSEYSCSWRYAGGIVSTMSYSIDDYMRYYSSGNEGTVSDDVLTELDTLGWEPKEEKNEQT
jgi:hypothetical protein